MCGGFFFNIGLFNLEFFHVVSVFGPNCRLNNSSLPSTRFASFSEGLWVRFDPGGEEPAYCMVKCHASMAKEGCRMTWVLAIHIKEILYVNLASPFGIQDPYIQTPKR